MDEERICERDMSFKSGVDPKAVAYKVSDGWLTILSAGLSHGLGLLMA